MKNLAYFLAGLVLLTLAVVIVVGQIPPKEIGSVTQGNEYNATSTGGLNQGLPFNTIKSGFGTFGSVILTVTPSKTIYFYDATTTNVNLRANTTSTLPILGFFPTSATVGTYVFDVVFTKGLLMVSDGVLSGNGSTTITWR